MSTLTNAINANTTTPLLLKQGGTSANLTASNGGIFYSTSSAGAILSGTATAGQLLLSGASAAPTWSTSTYPSTNAINTLLYASSANVMAALATANSAVLVTNSSGVPAWSGTMTNGQLIIGSTSGTPTAAALTAGTGISITNGAGSITITNSSNGVVWAANSSSSISAAVGNGYILTSGSATTVTLPTTFAVGTQIGIAGQGAAWTMSLGASTNIKVFGNTYTTSFASANNTDTIVLVGIVANTTWGILQMVSTGFTAS